MRNLVPTLFAVLLVAACSGEPKARPAARVLLVGIDGVEWSVLRPLLAQGKCPNLRSLMDRGAFGRLATMQPTLSPILWTTIATGRTPEEHGILGFTDADLHQYSSAQRRGRALWNIADRHGLESSVFGWWITWPAEAIRGTMVSGTSSSALLDANWKPALLPGEPGQVHPEERTAVIMEIAERAGSREEVERLASEEVFRDLDPSARAPVERRLVQETLWSIQSDATYFEIARTMLRERPADLAMIYLGGPDVVGHRFWRYYEPAAFRWPGAPEVKVTEALARAIPNYYEWIDEMLGALVEAAGPDVAVIVCSDHGMHAFSTDAPGERFLSGHHLDAPPGVIVAAGPGIARSGDVRAFLAGADPQPLGHVLAMTPTILALLGIPRSREMSEMGIEALLAGEARRNVYLEPVATHDEDFRAPSRVQTPEAMNRNFVERFKGLGYIGSETPEPSPPK
ncbi:MAG: alkaline phosphatase family protein [Planctomycetota bacterium]